jgi:hypothetical protein
MCSVPTCRKLTIGPSDDRVGRVTNIGVAAHITAAADDGPRYDVNLSSEDRKSESNGIWTCQNHGKSIDDNPSVNTVSELQRWKSQHEEWILSKLVHGIEGMESAILSVKLQNIGRFKEPVEIELGRNNVLLSGGSGGKTTVCQTLAAFSGGEHYEDFRNRFSFNESDEARRSIGIDTMKQGAKSSVSLIQTPAVLRNRSKLVKSRLSIEVDGGLRIDWPRENINVIKLDETIWFRKKNGLSLRNFVLYLAGMFQLPEDHIWGMMLEQHFVSSVFGTSFRRTARLRAEIRHFDSQEYYDEANVGPTVLTYAFLDLALKLVVASRNDTPWLLIIDTTFFNRLDTVNRSRIFTTLFQLKSPLIQVIICVNDENSLQFLKNLTPDSWAGASSSNGLTVHRFV